MRDLPIESTNSGVALKEKRKIAGCIAGAGSSSDQLRFPFLENPCFRERGITWLLALPVISKETDVFGVLSLYWTSEQKAACRADESLFSIAAALWPGIYQRIRESRRLQLITAVDTILAKSRTSVVDGNNLPASSLAPITPDEADDTMRKICYVVGKLLHAEEVSVFLSPLRFMERKWTCRASSWFAKPERVFTETFQPGITGWCLRQKTKPIYIPDLHSFKKDREWLDSLFPGGLGDLDWDDDLSLDSRDRENHSGLIPVRSFMAAPILMEGELLGVIRCTSKANSPLIYFSHSDIGAFEAVGTRIAQTWRNWQVAHSTSEEAKAWRSFNDRSRSFPETLRAAVSASSPDFSSIERQVLNACSESLARWGSCASQQALAGQSGDAAATGIAFTEKFAGAKDAMPVQGILEMAERQLDVYRTVFTLVREVRAGGKQLSRALSDLRHQIINPLNKGLLRANQHLRNYGHLSHVGDAVYPIRGLLRKSVNVANCFHLLVDLEKSGRLRIEASALDPRSLYVLLTEVVRDARLDLDPARNMDLKLVENVKIADPNPDAKPVYRGSGHGIRIDMKLIEQVLNSLLENATKYSNSNNTILLKVRLDDAGLRIEVRNRGARLSNEESVLAVERNWRSLTAMKYVGEGTGIGLYLVNAIAEAHAGKFMIHPTNEEGYTRAVFQIPKDNLK
ncbi:GAF domain-containing protein [Akkermansiaceae bacterium]|nr:GAF domain-containing protein [Akkermansiaceae bacterium]